MAGKFDPYSEWLGIQAAQRPLNNYQLLGLPNFESDSKVIENAVVQQIGRLAEHVKGEQSHLAKRITFELESAKTCLLNAATKAAYDAALSSPGRGTKERQAVAQETPRRAPASTRLRAVMSPVSAARPASPAPPVCTASPIVAPLNIAASPVAMPPSPAPQPPAFGPMPAVLNTPVHVTKSFSRKRSADHWILPVVIGGTATVVLLAVSLIFILCQEPPRDAEVLADVPAPATQPAAQDTVNNQNNRAASADKPDIRLPQIRPVADRTVMEGGRLQLPMALADQRRNDGSFRFVLASDAPPGAAIDPHTGLFTWTPMGSQTVGEHSITVRILTQGGENLSSQTTFRVIVQKKAVPPALEAISEQIVSAGRTHRFFVETKGFDDDGGGQVRFSLSQTPTWVTIDPLTGEVLCAPPETQLPQRYPVTVQATSLGTATLRDEKTFQVLVVRALPVPEVHRPAQAAKPPRSGSLRIDFPSGAILASVDLDIRDSAEHHKDTLMHMCSTGTPEAIGLRQVGPERNITVVSGMKGNQPSGPAILFHEHRDRIKQFVTYKSGKWDGILVRWDKEGKREFWCKYSNGRRNGLCCLFKNDQLTTVLESEKGDITGVHLIAGDEIVKTLNNLEEASADDVGAAAIEETLALEQRLKTEDRIVCNELKREAQFRIGAMNEQKRDAIQSRIGERREQRDREIQELRRRTGGLPRP